MNTKFKALAFIVGMAALWMLFSFTEVKKTADYAWTGMASYYHPKFNGRKTSTGEIFSNQKFTAANNFLKLGTLVRVTNLFNGKSVVVKINDRMNKKNRRLIDLSQAAARQLGLIQQGIGEVAMEVVHFDNKVEDPNNLWVLR